MPKPLPKDLPDFSSQVTPRANKGYEMGLGAWPRRWVSHKPVVRSGAERPTT
jgi:hypothetical protein